MPPFSVPYCWHSLIRTYVRMAAKHGVRKRFDWAAMQAYIDAGNGFLRCRARFGIAHATWAKAIRLGDIRVDMESKRYADARKRYDWRLVQAYYDRGFTMRACQKHFGFSSETWSKAVDRGAIRPRPSRWSVEDALNRSTSRATVKRHLLQAGILRNRCDWCGLSTWRDLPLSIQIDHINGIRDDHRVENLRMLCPNCHSQTETFAARNVKLLKSIPSSEAGITSDSDSEVRGSNPCSGASGPIV